MGFGQVWVRADASRAGQTGVLLLLALVTPLHAAFRTSLGVPAPPPSPTTRKSGVMVSSTALGVVGAAGIVAYALHLPDNMVSDGVGSLAVVLLLVGARPLVSRLVSRSLPAASRRLVLVVVDRRRPSLALGCALASLVACYALITVVSAIESSRSDLPRQQPAGSLLADHVPDDAIDALRATYDAVGGRQLAVYGVPRTRFGHVRAEPGAGALSFGEGPSAVAFDDSLGPDEIIASEFLSGESVVVDVLGADGAVSHAHTVRARSDRPLGGNLPGVLISPVGSLAHDLSMAPSGFSDVVLLDYGRLSEGKAAQMRSRIARVAPSALVNIAGGDPADPDIAMARTVTTVGSAVAVLASLAGLASGFVAFRRLRGTLTDVGATTRTRRSLALATAAPDTLAVLGVGLFLLLARDSEPRLMLSEPAAWLWTLPLACQLGVAALSAALFFAPPRRDT